LHDLKAIEGAILNGEKSRLATIQPSRLTHFNKADLEGKHMSEGEEFWFTGARQKNVQGWLLKPKGWKPGQNKKWPAVLLIHGGEYTALVELCRALTIWHRPTRSLGGSMVNSLEP
jgi:dipeptidyl aminopeptidase/acylaminoacyl peptidase